MSKEYDDYIVEHKNAVKACLELLAQEPTPIKNLTKNKINSIADSHDKSKYGSEEYDAYDNRFYKGVESSDPKIQEEFNKAWLHHIHANAHHWQHWVLIEDDGTKPIAIEIPEINIVEMVADWGSFSYRKKMPLEIREWYNSHKDKIIMHPNSRAKVEMLIDLLIERLKTVNFQ